MRTSSIAASWLATRWAMSLSPDRLARRRRAMWRRLQPAIVRTPALAPLAGRALRDFPVVEVAEMRADYGRWNSLGCSHEALHAAALEAEAGGPGELRPGVVAGYSTGGRGARGVFVASAAERADYIGQILARGVPAAALLRPMRIALVLRANSVLYSDSTGGRRRFMHLPLDVEPEAAAEALSRFSPTILIGPAFKLVELAGAAAAGRLALPDLERLFSGSEPLGEGERAWIAGVLGVRPDPIYQATEGFIAAACGRGRLHLNEHSFEIELEPVEGCPGFRPILTDLRRISQPIVRVRSDDYLELDPRGCGCGYGGRVIRPVMGRAGDVWRFAGRTVTPNAVAEAMDSLVAAPRAWQAIARRDHVELRLGGAGPQDEGLADRLRDRLVLPVPVELAGTPPDPPAPKRVRIAVSREEA